MSYQYPFIPGHTSMSSTPQTTYRWDDADQHHQQQQLERQVLQHPLHHQPEQDQEVFASVPTPSSSSTTVPLQEQIPIVPSQDPRRPGSSHVVEGDETQLRLQHVSVPVLLQPEHMRPPMIDTSRAAAYHVGTSASPPSGPPSAGPSTAFHVPAGLGPVRARISPVHPDPRAAAHPYRRPQSAADVVIARSRREPEEVQRVRYPRQPSSSTSMRAPHSTPATVATTPIPREVGFPVPASGAVKMISTYKGLINPAYSGTSTSTVHLVIRTDMHFNSETNILTALCELPGRSKSDVKVVLSTNTLNRVKQVVVTAKSPSPQDIAEEGYVVRERKSGSVSRTFVVPSETTPDDITVEMRDGLLTLKIQCPPPSQQDDAQEIMIR